ncbi:MAG: hypothetical protein IIB60_05580 [Planctomycetes bacterium]|nr:hypothetical protein [Planctomycetota bacterium]
MTGSEVGFKPGDVLLGHARTVRRIDREESSGPKSHEMLKQQACIPG